MPKKTKPVWTGRVGDLIRLPDWTVWRVIPEVKIWEAVALVLNIDPRKVRTDYRDGARIFRESRDFDELLLRAIRSSRLRRTEPSSSCSEEDSKVALSEFAAWAPSIGWDIPAGLAALAEDDDKNERAEIQQTKAPDGILRAMQQKYDELRASGDMTPADRMQRKLEREIPFSRGAIRRRWHLMKL